MATDPSESRHYRGGALQKISDPKKFFFLKNFFSQKFQELFLRTLENRKTIQALENHSKWLKSLSENLRVFKSF
jgi:hypothetical protein